MTEKFEVIFYGDVINCVRDETGREYNLHETITILNEQQDTNDYLEESNSRLQVQLGETLRLVDEQQATIRKLQDLCGKSDGENAKLRIENKMLEKEVNLLKPTNIEQYEQIQKLQEENEHLRKELGDCEKFRYQVFKRMNDEYIKECSIR